ncbi:Cys-tRNA(Pro) deacylase [Phenylobacterium sp. 20VBR1]|uniref:Cys-tRNA(Pro)/Cys-tRNA(Cys) deacylase n=1 Tax=Phenylobacterium glaciei TaxID=2803784 RepID=A0A941HYK3_9CAUL|nr:Cys-tRNA(Pro) deacylase [Phenylobacterium glaciei]MBR7621510.1 Cys-tRNA(Pro) deacylase [Phenylobacterium glaciei]
MAKTSPATLALGKAGVVFTLHTYDYDPDAGRVGLQAAQSLGADPARVLKTLMAQVDGRPVCAVLASDQEVAMKKLAAVFGGKAAAMMKPADAERMTGYRVGGVSPFGQKRLVPTVVDEAALLQDQVFVNGGQRGLQAQMAPADLVAALDAKVAEIT